MIDWKRLADFFPPDDIEWKPIAVSKKTGKGLAAAYITARAIQERLDEVFGPGGWKNEYREGPAGGVICRIYFKNDEGEWVWREDGAENTDIEAVKGGLSGALKRAGSALGIGRYLYQLEPTWHPVDDFGRFKQPPRLPSRFLPADQQPVRNGTPPSADPVAQFVAWARDHDLTDEQIMQAAGVEYGVTDLAELDRDQMRSLAKLLTA